MNIIDRQFNFLGQIDNYESLILTKSFSGIGSFELHLHENITNADKLVKENIIFTDVNKAFIILHREFNSTDGSVVIKGQDLKSYLARLITLPPDGYAYHRVNSNAETVMKTYVAHNLAERSITEIEVAPNQNRGSSLIYQTRYKNLGEELSKISLATGLGWDITLDLANKKFVFDVVEGKDRTAGQDALPPAIFSVEYDNLGEQKLIESRSNYRNVAIVGGQGEGTDRAISVVGDASGLDRFETFIDARDIENSTDLPSRGQQKLAEHREVLTFDSEVLTDRNLEYEKDFDLGDLVTAQNKKWNVTLNTRISEVTEIFEATGRRIEIALGGSLPTLIDVIKQATDAPITEGGGSNDDEPTTTNYNDLINKPRIESVVLVGNKTLEEIGVKTMTENEIDLLF